MVLQLSAQQLFTSLVVYIATTVAINDQKFSQKPQVLVQTKTCVFIIHFNL